MDRRSFKDITRFAEALQAKAICEDAQYQVLGDNGNSLVKLSRLQYLTPHITPERFRDQQNREETVFRQNEFPIVINLNKHSIIGVGEH